MQFGFGQIGRAVSGTEVAMFHGWAAELSALGAGVLGIVLLSVLSLHDLVELGGEHLAELVSVVLDFGERGGKWGTVFTVDLAAHQATEFLHLGENLGRVT